MEFHPSHARAVDRASGAKKNPRPAALAGIAVPQALETRASAGAWRSPSPPERAPRLIDLERRAKFARVDFAQV